MVTITNAIPVVFRHFKHLNTAINDILNQTLLPDEIIIIISEYIENNENNLIISNIEDRVKKQNINLIVRMFKEIQYAGVNRQIAYNLCNTDIIIFQDCDDFTHKQRNEILVKVYNKTKSPHILHGYTFYKSKEDENILNDFIDINKINIVDKKILIKNLYNGPANGPIFLNKTDIGKIIFPTIRKGQDCALNIMLFKKFNSVYIKNKKIYLYNNYLSSWA